MRSNLTMSPNSRLIEIADKMDELESIAESCDSDRDEDVLSNIELELAALIGELSSTERPQLHLV